MVHLLCGGGALQWFRYRNNHPSLWRLFLMVLNTKFTPTLKLEANTMAIFSDAAWIAALPASSNPVVPITIFCYERHKMRYVQECLPDAWNQSANQSCLFLHLNHLILWYLMYRYQQAHPHLHQLKRNLYAQKQHLIQPLLHYVPAWINWRPILPPAPAIRNF